MSYEKQNFVNGQKLKAEHLNHMEEGIAKASGVLVAKFEEYEDSEGAQLVCTTHTAAEINSALYAGIPVIAVVRIDTNQWTESALCWGDGYSVKVGCGRCDGGWSHSLGDEYSFADGDIHNKTIGNELWGEY